MATEGRITCSDPSKQLPFELAMKMCSQMFRVQNMKDLEHSLSCKTVSNTNLSELELTESKLDDLHKRFLKEHSYFEKAWPIGFLNHDYFTNGVHQQEAGILTRTKRFVNKLKQTIAASHLPSSIQSLSEIRLSKFSGDDLKSLLLTGESHAASTDILTQKYQNKRLLIQDNLDRIYDITTPVSRSSSSLVRLVSTVTEATKALQSMGVYQNLGDYFLVHHISRHLDQTTREAWELSLEGSRDYPCFQQLEQFIIARVKELEMFEAAPSQPTVSTRPANRPISDTESQAGSSSSYGSQTQYLCDCCNANHFMVMCPKFRELSVAARWTIVKAKHLCANCCGRHILQHCKSNISCKVCSSRHHTMLHQTQRFASHSSSELTHSTLSRGKKVSFKRQIANENANLSKKDSISFQQKKHRGSAAILFDVKSEGRGFRGV